VQPPKKNDTDEDNTEKISVYFGIGCFWHIQSEFINAEKNLLNRKNNELTSIAGYAGSNKVPKG